MPDEAGGSLAGVERKVSQLDDPNTYYTVISNFNSPGDVVVNQQVQYTRDGGPPETLCYYDTGMKDNGSTERRQFMSMSEMMGARFSCELENIEDGKVRFKSGVLLRSEVKKMLKEKT